MPDSSSPRRPSSPKLPKLHWRQTTCQVCGEVFDYIGSRRPKVCRSPECRYKYQFKIDREHWADYQPSLFEARRDN